MAALLLVLALGLGVAGAAAPVAEDRAAEVEARLAALEAPDAATRERAERWLAARLAAEDRARVAAAAEEVGPEGARRLARALGAHDARLGLAVELARDERAGPRAVGEAAFGELLLRWSVHHDRPALAGADLREALSALSDDVGPGLLEVDAARPAGEAFDRLHRLGGAPVAIVLDPRVDRRAPSAVDEPTPLVGTWPQVLLALAGAHALEVELLGVDPEEPGGIGGVARVVPPGAAGRESGREVLLGWSLATLDGAPERRARYAGALASTGWPAAIAWLEGRWRASDDAAAREGALAAAAAGARLDALDRTEVVRELLELARARLDAGDADGASRVARALAAGGCTSPGGARLAPVLLEGWDALDDAARRTALVALEGRACALEPAERAALAALLAAPPRSHEPGLLRQALRAWVATAGGLGPAPAPAVGDPFGALGGLDAWDLEERLAAAALLAASGARPPEEGGDGVVPPTLVEARVALAAWLAEAGERERAARVLLALGRGGRGFAPPRGADTLLARWARRGDLDLARDIAARARAAAEPDEREALDRLALRAGLLDADERAALAPAALEAAGSDDPELLAALAAAPRGEVGAEARRRLLALLTDALAAREPLERVVPLLEDVEAALDALLRAGADEAADELRRRAWVTVRAAEPGPVADALRRTRWPPNPPARAVRVLERLDRSVTDG